MQLQKSLKPWSKHYLPQVLLILSLILLAYSTVEFFKAQRLHKVVKAVPLNQFISVDRIPVVKINGKTLGVLAIQKGHHKKGPQVWIKNMQTQKIAKFSVGQNIFHTGVYLSGIKKSRLELQSKSGIHHLLLRK